MKKFFSDSHLLWCQNTDSIPLVVLGHESSCDVYSPDMVFLGSVELPFRPGAYLVVSKTSFLVFDNMTNRHGIVDIEKAKFTPNKSPLGTSNNKMLLHSAIYQVDDGFVFFPIHTLSRDKTFFYSPLTNKFKRIDMELPDICFSFRAGKHGAFYLQDEEGNLKACSFKTAFEKRKFVPEMTVEKELFSDYVYADRKDDLPSAVAYLSIEKKTLILAVQDKPDLNAFKEYLKKNGSTIIDKAALGSIEFKQSGKVVLIKNGAQKKVVSLETIPFKPFFQPFLDSVVFVNYNAYSTEDLSLLATSPALGPMPLFLPDGKLIYNVLNDEVCITDSSPFAIASKSWLK